MKFHERAPRVTAVTLTDRSLHFSRPPSPLTQQADIVVVMALRNQASQLSAALTSALAQDVEPERLAVLILDDQSSDDWQESAHSCLTDDRVAVAHGVCGSAAHARNALLDLVDAYFPAARWIARLDADDVFASPEVLRAMISKGDRAGATFVLGSNHLDLGGLRLVDSNMADTEVLLDQRRLRAFIEEFCHQRSRFELPSCNLVIRARQGIRYPMVRSAEDHWLVASLLIFRPREAAIVPEPVYCTYRLEGETTKQNRQSVEWLQTRSRLAQAFSIWCDTLKRPGRVLGHGMEGIVWSEDDTIYKRFYPWTMQSERLKTVQQLASGCPGHIVDFEVFSPKSGACVTRHTWQPLQAISGLIQQDVLREFLAALWRAKVVTSNIKRDNLRLSPEGRLVYIDIGADIVPLSVSHFIDCAARAYAVLVLGWSEFELARRETTRREEEVLADLPGFEHFYGELVAELHPLVKFPEVARLPCYGHDDVSLLIKCCAQDVGMLREQVLHLVGTLAGQTRFARRILLVDPFEGPYLREFDKGDLHALLKVADQLESESWVDEVWISPQDQRAVADVNARWFDAGSCEASHTNQGAPVTAQVWAFDQVGTRYVLQVDCDVLVGREDATHDYLSDMLVAISPEDVWCVGFNIPKARPGFTHYTSRPGGFVPEIRLGLLDLSRIRTHRPFANPVLEGRLSLMWHRALEQEQKRIGMQSLRGGDSRTFYIHPMNRDKLDPRLPAVRDLVAQARYPTCQAEQWDLDLSLDWRYPKRTEDIVFLLLGKNTPQRLFQRCIASLQAQSKQDFGVIIVDDASETLFSQEMPFALGPLTTRTTLVRHSHRQGYMSNFRLAVEDICVRPETLVVVLDQDDALMSPTVVESLWRRWDEGADMIHAPMFRPEKPLRRYTPDYTSPRSKGGGNVWAHLRGFRKSLFTAVPSAEWDLPSAYFDVLSDFLMMVPMAELAERPVWIDEGYACLHQRLPYSSERKAAEMSAKRWLADRQPLLKHR